MLPLKGIQQSKESMSTTSQEARGEGRDGRVVSCLCVFVCVWLYLCLHPSSLPLPPPFFSSVSPFLITFLLSHILSYFSLFPSQIHTHSHAHPSPHLRLWAHRMILLSINIDEKSWMIFRQLSVENNMEKSTCTHKKTANQLSHWHRKRVQRVIKYQLFKFHKEIHTL